ncbi:MAG: carboxymuconolactone decarboxylase family protein [Proteobacteria bacterium]|nr:carboxymuconolactone decarboxylase family protein [Pseudomonadota bacterium]
MVVRFAPAQWYSFLESPKEIAMPAAKSPPTTIAAVKDIVPKLAELTEKVLFGDVWARPGLSRRDRSLATVAALIALYRPDQLKGHLWRALDNGVTREELSELFTHLAFYAGWANGISAAQVAKQVYQERGT